MNSTRRHMLRPATALLATAIGIFSALIPAHALEQGRTEQQRPFVSGGISIEEVAQLEARRQQYRLWLATLDVKSGAWLAGARTTIRDARGDTVLDVELDGPYLFVDLAAGRYTMVVTFEGAAQRYPLLIPERGLQRVLARFDSGALVSPDMPEAAAALPQTAEPISPTDFPKP